MVKGCQSRSGEASHHQVKPFGVPAKGEALLYTPGFAVGFKAAAAGAELGLGLFFVLSVQVVEWPTRLEELLKMT